MNNEKNTGLKQRLEKLEWPNLFPFKFIVPVNQLDAVMSLFPYQETSIRLSSKGNYASLSANSFVINSDKVLEVYERASSIKGIIML